MCVFVGIRASLCACVALTLYPSEVVLAIHDNVCVHEPYEAGDEENSHGPMEILALKDIFHHREEGV